VGYLGELSPEAALALLDYVEQGGGLVFFCGEGSVDRNLAALEALRNGGVLPWQPGPPRNLPARDDALRITAGKWQTRLLREFDEQSQIAISQIPFRRAWITGALRSDAQVLLSFSDGTPALASRSIGAGQLLLANFSPSLESSELGKYGSFVALVQVIARQLRPARDQAALAVVGQPYRYPGLLGVEAGSLEVFGPDGQTVPATVTAQGEKLAVHLPRPEQPGVYRLQRSQQTVGLAAVNIDPRESDLRRLDRAALARQFETAGVAMDVQNIDGRQPVLNLHGRPLWGWCLAAAMFVAGVELLCLGWWRR
jgi:hypothetical protein